MPDTGSYCHTQRHKGIISKMDWNNQIQSIFTLFYKIIELSTPNESNKTLLKELKV